MAGNNHYQILKLETPNGVDSIIQSLATLHATKNVDERGRQKWIYIKTPQIRDHTNTLLNMDSSVNESIGKQGLIVCTIEKDPRIIRTGNGVSDYQEARPGSIAIITPMTHNKARIWLAQIGEPFSESSFIDAGKEDMVIILPNTKFRLKVPYYLMIRRVQEI
ncbi:hypothetical protein J3458_000722 [Metarhizium acridum]|uniref:uncharacterized protein n=1 Tax=Metarhizium acridum TaxID=92637 RepID=UPI001C6BFEAD|nr:hypothetical protein J3458_000722 [Metarhizium acridum]